MKKIEDKGVVIVMTPRELDKARDMLRLSVILMDNYIEKLQKLMQEGVDRRETIRNVEELRANAFTWIEGLSK